jgi:hypothetical protein
MPLASTSNVTSTWGTPLQIQNEISYSLQKHHTALTRCIIISTSHSAVSTGFQDCEEHFTLFRLSENVCNLIDFTVT